MLHDGLARRVAIIGGMRIPFARAHSIYTEASNKDMMTATLAALVDKFDLRGQTLGDVALGAVIKHSRDWNLARESVMASGLSMRTPGVDMPLFISAIRSHSSKLKQASRAELIQLATRQLCLMTAYEKCFLRAIAADLYLKRSHHGSACVPDTSYPSFPASLSHAPDSPWVKAWKLRRSNLK